ncbi:MAG TPA: cytochrome P450 [Acidimicrobiales bacterium]|nr:cytochrome P450 [Acidimicrobiales bacterium]
MPGHPERAVDLAGVDLSDADVFADGPPHAAYRSLRDHAPVFWHAPTAATPDGEGFWCLTRHDDVTWAAKQSAVFSSAGGGDRDGGGTLIEDLPAGFAAGVLLNMQDDPRHHHIRRLVTPSVALKRLRVMKDALAARRDEILDAAVARGDVDFLVDVAAELPLQAIASLLGIPQSDRHFLLEWADATLDYDDRDPGSDSARSQAAAAEMAGYTSRLLDDKRRCPAEDILSVVTHADLPGEADPGGPLSELEQEMFVHLLVAAGTETTRNTITAGMLALIDRPDDWDALRSDRSLLPSAVDEMLRWASSTIYNRRTATRDVERHGQTIRAGDKVVLWWQAANYDDRVFVDPHRFDIRRDPNPHVAFGLGSHFCLGANLARLEIDLVFDGLLDRVACPVLNGRPERTRSNKHAGYRHAPVSLRA